MPIKAFRKIIRKPETVYDISQLVRLRRLDLQKRHEVTSDILS